MQAIETKYIGPTNTKGSRIKATAWAGSVTVPYDHSLSLDSNHRAAALRLCELHQWNSQHHGDIMGGDLKNGNSVWVLVTPSAYACQKLQRVLDYLCEERQMLGDSFSRDKKDEVFGEIQNLARAVRVVEAAYAAA